MGLRVKIIIAKELKRIGIALVIATLGFIVVLLIGLYYQKQEYAKYLQEKTDVEAEVAEWKKETLKRQKELATEKGIAFTKLSAYVMTDRYFSQSYNDYKLRWGFDSFLSQDLALISFVKATLQSNYYNEHIRKLGILYRAYENCYVISSIDITNEERERLYRVSSFNAYKEHLGDNYPSIRKSPPIESAFAIFIGILFAYVYIRFLICLVQLIIRSIRWVNRTSKLRIDNTEGNGKK